MGSAGNERSRESGSNLDGTRSAARPIRHIFQEAWIVGQGTEALWMLIRKGWRIKSGLCVESTIMGERTLTGMHSPVKRRRHSIIAV